MSNNTKSDNQAIWSDNTLMQRIEAYGYIMADMGRNLGFEAEARNRGDYDNVRFHANHAEMQRVTAHELKKDINAQITLRRTNNLVTA